ELLRRDDALVPELTQPLELVEHVLLLAREVLRDLLALLELLLVRLARGAHVEVRQRAAAGEVPERDLADGVGRRARHDGHRDAADDAAEAGDELERVGADP